MKKSILILSFLFILIGCTSHGTKLEIGKGELYYTDNVTAEEAQKTGDFLLELGYLSTEKQTSFQLDRDKDVYKIRMVVKDEFLKGDTSLDYSFIAMGTLASSRLFGGKTVQVDLCNEYLEVKRSIVSN